jgi:hypothetical protein
VKNFLPCSSNPQHNESKCHFQQLVNTWHKSLGVGPHFSLPVEILPEVILAGAITRTNEHIGPVVWNRHAVDIQQQACHIQTAEQTQYTTSVINVTRQPRL